MNWNPENNYEKSALVPKLDFLIKECRPVRVAETSTRSSIAEMFQILEVRLQMIVETLKFSIYWC